MEKLIWINFISSLLAAWEWLPTMDPDSQAADTLPADLVDFPYGSESYLSAYSYHRRVVHRNSSYYLHIYLNVSYQSSSVCQWFIEIKWFHKWIKYLLFFPLIIIYIYNILYIHHYSSHISEVFFTLGRHHLYAGKQWAMTKDNASGVCHICFLVWGYWHLSMRR